MVTVEEELAEARYLWDEFGNCADCMARPDRADLQRCLELCRTLRSRLATGDDDRILALAGDMETLARDPDPDWSTVGAIALVLGQLNAALRPTG